MPSASSKFISRQTERLLQNAKKARWVFIGLAVVSAVILIFAYSHLVTTYGAKKASSATNTPYAPTFTSRSENGLMYVISPDGTILVSASEKINGSCEIPAVYNGKNVVQIGDSALVGQDGMTALILPDTCTQIGAQSLAGCTSLTSVSMPSGLTTIGNAAFAGCLSLEQLTIPASVTSIGGNAFDSCMNLTLAVTDGSYAHNYAVEAGIPFVLV